MKNGVTINTMIQAFVKTANLTLAKHAVMDQDKELIVEHWQSPA